MPTPYFFSPSWQLQWKQSGALHPTNPSCKHRTIRICEGLGVAELLPSLQVQWKCLTSIQKVTRFKLFEILHPNNIQIPWSVPCGFPPSELFTCSVSSAHLLPGPQERYALLSTQRLLLPLLPLPVTASYHFFYITSITCITLTFCPFPLEKKPLHTENT